MRVGVLEEDGVLAESIEVRRLNTAIAVGRQVVGAKRVDRDEDDWGAAEDEAPLLPAAAEGSREKSEGEGGSPCGSCPATLRLC
jgi:hypothetical protein